MTKIVGIDLGTTNSLVATVEAGIPLVIADAQGRRLTPSVVHFPSAATEPVVGEPANRVQALKPAETVYSVKRFIGRRASEIAPAEREVTYGLAGEGAGPIAVSIQGRNFSAEQISAEVLKKLKHDTRGYTGPRVFQRRPTQRHEKSRRTGRLHRRAHH
jgi:molecular chaperone DnaK